jgi:hypothetical protein
MNEIIQKIKKKIKKSENGLIENINLEEEGDLTSRLLQNFERDFKEIHSRKYKIKTKVFKRSGPSSEENKIGADLIILLNIKNKSSEINKFFLAQSKKIDHKNNLKFDPRLYQQCRKMLNITSDSFIFVYTPEGIFVKSAINTFLNYKKITSFFGDFLSCFIGEIINIPHHFCFPCLNNCYCNLLNKEELIGKINMLELTIEPLDINNQIFSDHF